MKEVAIETQASIDAGEDGAMYFNAYYLPELEIILKVTALTPTDAEQAKNKFVKDRTN